jgi:hypothetical protein
MVHATLLSRVNGRIQMGTFVLVVKKMIDSIDCSMVNALPLQAAIDQQLHSVVLTHCGNQLLTRWNSARELVEGEEDESGQ